MRGVYTGYFAHSALAAAKSLIIVTAPASRAVEILKASVTNRTQETNEQLEIGIYRASGGTRGTPTAMTPSPCEVNDGAAASLVEHTWGTDPTVGVPLDVQGVAGLSGYFYDPTPEERIVLPAAGIIVLRIVTATFTAFDAVAMIRFREIG